jgi:hypothetical protein
VTLSEGNPRDGHSNDACDLGAAKALPCSGDFLFSKTAQLKLREMSRIPSRSDVDAEPPRLIKGFKRVFQDIENENMSESIRLFQQTFGLSAG